MAARVIYQTSLTRSVLALAAGSIAGASAFALIYLIGEFQTFGLSYVTRYGLSTATMAFKLALAAWAVSLTLVGAPLWWLADRFNWRGWLHAMAFGAILTFSTSLALSSGRFGLAGSRNVEASDSGGATVSGGRLTLHGWVGALSDSLVFSALGTCISLIIWRIAYRRLQPVPKALQNS
jgi:hypothetical protein